MRFLNASVSLAESRGFLPLRPDTQWLSPLPGWLADLQQPGGLDRFESLLGVPIPAAVREFWGLPDLVRLLDAWRWEDFLSEEPRVFSWSFAPHLLVSSHPHSGGTLAVRLGTSDDPLLSWGWEDDETPTDSDACRFSEYVFRYVQGGRDRNASGDSGEQGAAADQPRE